MLSSLFYNQENDNEENNIDLNKFQSKEKSQNQLQIGKKKKI